VLCSECNRSNDDKCSLPACVYRHISAKDLLGKGVRIKAGMWLYEDKTYKSIDFEGATNSFICVEVRDAT
jgi:hypothetical protein